MFHKASILLLTAIICLPVFITAEATPRDNRAVQQHHKPIMSLPKTHHRIVHNGKSFFYNNGRFYRHLNGAYLSITAPIGVIVPALPVGYITFSIGPGRFFYYAGVYYRRTANGYVVIEKPAEAEEVLSMSGSKTLIIYPANSQGDEQKSRDKYECHEWAVEESHFDPSDLNSDPILRADYHRAIRACLEARQYVVK